MKSGDGYNMLKLVSLHPSKISSQNISTNNISVNECESFSESDSSPTLKRSSLILKMCVNENVSVQRLMLLKSLKSNTSTNKMENILSRLDKKGYNVSTPSQSGIYKAADIIFGNHINSLKEKIAQGMT